MKFIFVTILNEQGTQENDNLEHIAIKKLKFWAEECKTLHMRLEHPFRIHFLRWKYTPWIPERLFY